MRAGDLRHLVTAIEKREQSIDSFGQPELDDFEVATFWARVEPLRGNELFDARQVMPETTHRIVCRSQPKVDAGMRIDFEGRSLELLEPPRDRDERGIEQEFLCREIRE